MAFSSKSIVRIVLVILAFTGMYGCVQKEGGPVRETTAPSTVTQAAVHGSMLATINGEKWVAEGSPSEDLENVIATIDPRTGTLTITGHHYIHHAMERDAQEEIEITCKNIEPGNYTLFPDFDHYQTAVYSKRVDSSQVYFIHEHQGGELILSRVDTAEHRLFGTFHFNCRSTKGKDVQIEEGSFDNVKYSE